MADQIDLVWLAQSYVSRRKLPAKKRLCKKAFVCSVNSQSVAFSLIIRLHNLQREGGLVDLDSEIILLCLCLIQTTLSMTCDNQFLLCPHETLNSGILEHSTQHTFRPWQWQRFTLQTKHWRPSHTHTCTLSAKAHIVEELDKSWSDLDLARRPQRKAASLASDLDLAIASSLSLLLWQDLARG